MLHAIGHDQCQLSIRSPQRQAEFLSASGLAGHKGWEVRIMGEEIQGARRPWDFTVPEYLGTTKMDSMLVGLGNSSHEDIVNKILNKVGWPPGGEGLQANRIVANVNVVESSSLPTYSHEFFTKIFHDVNDKTGVQSLHELIVMDGINILYEIR